ncbi:hypothetical protein [Cognatilysobacter terrigena]|uniref:hypothetical protein n=1 Tax=Cognatilysobacter terrigena TaxID=2488749 RepID=UPI001FEB9657|nr:hypothetical protein [Lysobacter terrigena]
MSTEARAPLSVLDEILCTVLAVGTVLVVLLPAARGDSALGWLPMWLIGMPAVAWWALHGFAMPRRAVEGAPVPVAVTSRRTAPQARRRVRPAHRVEVRRAA